jgi:hypothetical protein
MGKKVLFKPSKRFNSGNRVLGVGGEYEVDIELAKNWKSMGRGSYKGSHGVNQDESSVNEEYKPSNPFMAQILVNAAEILTVLQNESKKQSEPKKDEPKDEELPEDDESEETETENTEKSSVDETTQDETTEVETTEVDDSSAVTKETEETQEEEKTPILEGFPGKAELEAKGILYIEDIPTTKKGLQDLDISTRVANQIGARLAELK